MSLSTAHSQKATALPYRAVQSSENIYIKPDSCLTVTKKPRKSERSYKELKSSKEEEFSNWTGTRIGKPKVQKLQQAETETEISNRRA